MSCLDKGEGVIAPAMTPEGHFNIKIPSYHYKDYQYKENTVSWLAYLYNGNIHTYKDGLYTEMGPCDMPYSYTDIRPS